MAEPVATVGAGEETGPERRDCDAGRARPKAPAEHPDGQEPQNPEASAANDTDDDTSGHDEDVEEVPALLEIPPRKGLKHWTISTFVVETQALSPQPPVKRLKSSVEEDEMVQTDERPSDEYPLSIWEKIALWESPVPPAEHPDGQEPENPEAGAANDTDNALSGHEEVPAPVKVPSKEASRHRASISDASLRAASVGETQALSPQLPVKRLKSSVEEDEMVQTDERPSDEYPLSIWEKIALWESPVPPAEHPDGQEAQNPQAGAANDTDNALSGHEEVPARVKVPSKEASRRRASISDASLRAASVGETQGLSPRPPVKRQRSSVREDEMVQTDERPSDEYPLSIWEKIALWESPVPPAEHPDGQEAQNPQAGAANDTDNALSGHEEVPAPLKVPSKEASRHRASISDASLRAASVGETQALSPWPPVKRQRSSVREDEMVQTDERPSRTPLGNGALSIWEKTAPFASPSGDVKHCVQPALGSTLLPKPPFKEQTRRGSSSVGGSKAGRLSCAAEEDVQQGGKKKCKWLLKKLKGQSPTRPADALGTSTNSAPASLNAPAFPSAPELSTAPTSSYAPSFPPAPVYSNVSSLLHLAALRGLPKLSNQSMTTVCHLDKEKFEGDPFPSGTAKTGIKRAAVGSPQWSRKNEIRYYTPRENTSKNGIPSQQATATKQNGSEASKERLPNLPPAVSKKPPAPEAKKSTSQGKPEPFAPLTKAMEEEIAAAFSYRNPDEILSSAFKLKVTREDIQTLEELRWLNDMIINFYMALLVDRSNRKKGPSVFAFSTFFYDKLCSGGYSAVKRWSKGVDLFTKDIIFVPVNSRCHWTLGVIDVRKKSIRHYDSLGRKGAKICQVLLEFLQEESLEKRQVELDCSEWTLHSMEPHEIPQQENGSDCGVFICKYADYISQDEPMTFTQRHMPYFRRKMAWEIIHQQLL